MSGEYDWKGPFVGTGAKVYHQPVIRHHLWQAIDIMAATGEGPDQQTWDHLKVYLPKEWKDAINQHAREVADPTPTI